MVLGIDGAKQDLSQPDLFCCHLAGTITGTTEKSMRATLIALLGTIAIISMANWAYADPVADAQLLAANNLRKQLPMKIDEQTTLWAVAAVGRMAKYSYRLDAEKKNIPSSWYLKQKSLLTNNVCSHPLMRKMVKMGATYSYLYSDADGKFLTDISVGYSDC